MDFDRFFGTVTSSGYIDKTAGLFASLMELYPKAKLVVCGLDDHTCSVWEGRQRNVCCVSAEEVWGSELWQNLRARSNQKELAFATKAALAVWALKNGLSPIHVLDSDLLLLAPIDDVLDEASSHDVVLVSNLHPLNTWWRSDLAGLFWAGLVSFSRLEAAHSWKSLCFSACRGLPISGLYFEQKYLDYLVAHFDSFVVRDPSIYGGEIRYKEVDASTTIAKLPSFPPGKPAPRIFHASRATSRDLPLAQLKRLFDEKGLSLIGYSTRDADAATSGGRVSKLQLRRRIPIGWWLELTLHRITRGLPTLFTLYRVLSLRSGSLRGRLRESFFTKRVLEDRLIRRVIETTETTEEERSI